MVFKMMFKPDLKIVFECDKTCYAVKPVVDNIDRVLIDNPLGSLNSMCVPHSERLDIIEKQLTLQNQLPN